MKIKAWVQEYNAYQAVAGSTDCLTLVDALESSTLAMILQPKLCAFTPHRQELISTYIMLKQRREEIETLKSDMANTILFNEDGRAAIVRSLASIGQEGAYDRGAMPSCGVHCKTLTDK